MQGAALRGWEPPSLRGSGTAAVTCCSRASKDARLPGRLARASRSPASHHLPRDGPAFHQLQRMGGLQPLSPQPTNSWVSRWFPAAEHPPQPGMLMLTQLENHAAQEVTQAPQGWPCSTQCWEPQSSSPANRWVMSPLPAAPPDPRPARVARAEENRSGLAARSAGV